MRSWRGSRLRGGTAVALPLDVGVSASSDAFRQAVSDTLQSWGRDTFDVLVNNADYGLYNLMETVTEEEFDGLFGVHLKGPLFLTQSRAENAMACLRCIVRSASSQLSIIGVNRPSFGRRTLEVRQ